MEEASHLHHIVETLKKAMALDPILRNKLETARPHFDSIPYKYWEERLDFYYPYLTGKQIEENYLTQDQFTIYQEMAISQMDGK